MGDIQKRLDNVRQMIQSQDFLEGKGLSNEVNIRIFCYEPRDEMAVRHFIEQLSTDMTLGCQLRICNLYQIFLGICEGMDILDAIPDMEEEDGHDYLLEQLQSTIGVDEIVQKIQSEPFQPGEVLVLTGVGEAFPFMRIHTLLETSVYKGYKQDKIEMRGDRAEMSDFPLYLNTVAGGLDRRDQTIGGFSFVVKIYAVPVVEIIGQLLYLLGRYGFNAQFSDCL